MKNVTVNIQIQFDVFSDNEDDIQEEVGKALAEMSEVLGQRFNDRSPTIFTNSIDSSDIEISYDNEIVQNCVDEGTHLKSCDDDGFCNECGYQD